RLLGGFFAVVARQIVGFFHPVGEEFSGNALGVFFLCRERRAVVKVLVEKVFQPVALLFDGRAEGGKPLFVAADTFKRMHARRFHALRRVRNQVSDQAVKNAFQRLVKDQLLGSIRVPVSCLAVMPRKKIHAVRNLLDLQQAGLVAVVQVGGVVGNLVGQV